jgi:hypothetical protein
LTTTTPSKFVLVPTSSEVSAHVTDAASQPLAQLDVAAQVVPAVSHVSMLLPLQRVAPGVQAPVHSPLEHATAHVAS